jgi:hypothetical protein
VEQWRSQELYEIFAGVGVYFLLHRETEVQDDNGDDNSPWTFGSLIYASFTLDHASQAINLCRR